MNDRSSEQVNYNELKFSKEKSFFDKSLAVRWAIGLLFAITLFCILHFREISVESLELNAVAPGYVVSQVDFDFYDEEATIILKQEAVRDIGKIFKLEENEVRLRRSEFESFLTYNEDWRKNSSEGSFEEMYEGVDLLEKTLSELLFTDPRTMQRLREVGLLTPNYQAYAPTSLSEEVFLPPHIWNHLRDITFSEGDFDKNAAGFIIKWFQEKQWRIQEDIPAQTLLAKKLKAKVADKYTHVRGGNRIIDQGEKVTARHVAMMQAMQKVLRERRNLWHPLTIAGSVMMMLLLTSICFVYFYNHHRQLLQSNRKLFLLVTIVILVLAIAKITEFFLLFSKSNLIDFIRYPVFVPFAAILLCSLINSGIATFAGGFLTVILTMSLVFERQGFMIINLVAALVTILSTRSLKHRKEVFVVCAKAWLSCIIAIFALSFYQDTLWSLGVFLDIMSVSISMLFTAILVVGLLPLLESTFKVMTDVTLTEYMDPNNELLKHLAIEAPGTYQHSIVVGNLAEAAALAISANGLFCRVATLYHDIGKMVNPQYFTENQQEGINIHQLLTPKESAQVIMGHVTEGVALVRSAGLPEQFVDIIKEHHGTTLVYYFYRKELERLGGDASLIDEKDFRYPGPKPRSKESAIIMITDSIEAASRSLADLNEDSLMQLASRLIREKEADGQLDHCLLTFEELAIVKATLVKTLLAYGHSRIKYPTRE